MVVSKKSTPRPGIEPGPSTWQAEILTTRLSRTDSEEILDQRTRPNYRLDLFKNNDFINKLTEGEVTVKIASFIKIDIWFELKTGPLCMKLYYSNIKKGKEKYYPSSRIWTSDLWITD